MKLRRMNRGTKRKGTSVILSNLVFENNRKNSPGSPISHTEIPVVAPLRGSMLSKLENSDREKEMDDITKEREQNNEETEEKSVEDDVVLSNPVFENNEDFPP